MLLQRPVSAPGSCLTIIRHRQLAYLAAGRLDEVIASNRTVLRLSPEYSGAHHQIGEVLLKRGDANAALAEIQQEPSESWRLNGLTMAYHALGRQAESDAALNELIEKYGKTLAWGIACAGLARRSRPRLRMAEQSGPAGPHSSVDCRLPDVGQPPLGPALAAFPAEDRYGPRAARGDQVRREGAEPVEVAHRSSDGCP